MIMNKCRLTTYLAISVVIMIVLTEHSSYGMDTDTKRKLRSKVMEMFRHAYGAYMKHAFPADELMPLSCKGRYRGSEPSRGDVDDSLGNFTLSLIDSLDTLAVLGDLPEFERAISLVISTTKFDTDVIVSVFETNIRVLGGLLGGHVLASYLKRKKHAMDWYKDELLTMAKDIGTRLLPAFNTTTGMPYPRINLKHGINHEISVNYRDTCTACAGTMILEFAALSRLTGDPVFEEKAHKAMDYIWNQRHRSSDLVGTVINVHNGDWIRRESGVGAGIDSYYEYVLKAYILLGDDTYLTRFNKHYDAVKKYISQGPRFIDVHMHKPLSTSRNFMDALQAFWPGLQVLKGDIQPAIEVHEMLYQVIQKHNFLPEAFTSDFHVHWGHHPLRPEFVESTYFLYKATGDPHYLEVGQKVIENLEMHARVPCGFAALKDVTRGTHEDQMDSFVLAETFKYLYLMYTDKEDILFDVDDYIFTTEAHLLPLSLSRCNGSKPASMRLSREMYSHLQQIDEESHKHDEYGDSSHNTCPNPQIKYTFNYASNLRAGLKNMVDQSKSSVTASQQCSQVQMSDSRLKAVDFVAGNQDQLNQLKEMGIRLMTMSDGRIQLLHTATEALNPQLAEEGLQFMQEMIELSKKQPNSSQNDAMVIKVLLSDEDSHVFRAGPAQFGYDLKTRPSIRGKLTQGKPYKMCTNEVSNPGELLGRIALIERGSCMFVDKARNLQRAGAIGGIVIDHTPGSTTTGAPLFAMSGDGTDDVYIPMLFLFHGEGQQLIKMWRNDPELEVVMVAKLEVLGPEVPSVQESISGDQSKQSHDSTDQSQRGSEPQSEKPIQAHHEQTLKLNKMTDVKNGVYIVSMEEEATSSGVPARLMQDELGIINIKSLADGSKQLFFRFDKLENYDKSTPSSLEDIFENLRTTLMEKTNFKFLNKQEDYLTAIVRLLEVAYFREQTIDQRSQGLYQELSNELEILSAEDVAAGRHLNSDQSEELLQMDDHNSDESATEEESVKPDAELEEVNVIRQGGIAVKIRTKIVKPVQESSSTAQINVEDTHSYADKNDFDDSMKSYHLEKSRPSYDFKELRKDKLQDAARYLDSLERREEIERMEAVLKEAIMQGMTRKEQEVLDNKEKVNKGLFTDNNNNDINFATLEQNVNRELADGLRQVLEKSDPSADQTGSQTDNLVSKNEKQDVERTVQSLPSADSKNVKIESDNNNKNTFNSVNSEHDSGSSTVESGQTSRKSGEL